MPTLKISGLNPLGTSEEQNIIIFPSNTDGSAVQRGFSNNGEFYATLDPGEYIVSIISLVYKSANYEINVTADNELTINMEVDYDFRPSDDADYLKTRGWNFDGEMWISPQKTFSNFDPFLCAKFNEFLDSVAKDAKEKNLKELNDLIKRDPKTFESIMWNQYKSSTKDIYNDFVTSNIVDA